MFHVEQFSFIPYHHTSSTSRVELLTPYLELNLPYTYVPRGTLLLNRLGCSTIRGDDSIPPRRNTEFQFFPVWNLPLV